MGKEQTDAQVIKGLLDTLVLEVLSVEMNYGFGIYQKITSKLGDDGGIFREATLYPLLHRLEAKGLVDSRWKPGDRGTDRKYYKITRDGEALLKQRVKDWTQVARILDCTILRS